MPNNFAYFAILAWPLVAVVLFRIFPVPKAAAISIIAGYLLLPVRTSYNLPLLPTYDREFAAAFPALLLAIIHTRQPAIRPVAPLPSESSGLDGWLPKAMVPRICLIALLVAPFITAMMNGNALHYGPTVLRGLGFYDAASAVLSAATNLLPFIIARKFLAHPREHTMLLVLLCLAGLAYSLPALYEVRMSPQLSRMIYGVGPDWIMSLRGGGYRPSVFLGHGLRLGILIAVCVLAALGCARARKPSERILFYGAAAWLLLTLVLCKTVGALLIAVALAPVVLLFGVRLQLITAAVLAGIVLVYPMMRGADLVPTETIVQGVSKIAESQRVASLNFRFKNEDILLEKSRERPLFGWGGWGRSHVYNERGNKTVVTDGLWIIVFGEGGWVRYLSQFGLLTVPIMMLALRRRQYEITIVTSALCLALAANLIDLIPNAGISPVVWLLAGALVGRMEVKTADKAEPEAAAAPVQTSPYRRTFPTEGNGRSAPSFRRGVRTEVGHTARSRRGG